MKFPRFKLCDGRAHHGKVDQLCFVRRLLEGLFLASHVCMASSTLFSILGRGSSTMVNSRHAPAAAAAPACAALLSFFFYEHIHIYPAYKRFHDSSTVVPEVMRSS